MSARLWFRYVLIGMALAVGFVIVLGVVEQWDTVSAFQSAKRDCERLYGAGSWVPDPYREGWYHCDGLAPYRTRTP